MCFRCGRGLQNTPLDIHVAAYGRRWVCVCVYASMCVPQSGHSPTHSSLWLASTETQAQRGALPCLRAEHSSLCVCSPTPRPHTHPHPPTPPTLSPHSSAPNPQTVPTKVLLIRWLNYSCKNNVDISLENCSVSDTISQRWTPAIVIQHPQTPSPPPTTHTGPPPQLTPQASLSLLRSFSPIFFACYNNPLPFHPHFL